MRTWCAREFSGEALVAHGGSARARTRGSVHNVDYGSTRVKKIFVADVPDDLAHETPSAFGWYVPRKRDARRIPIRPRQVVLSFATMGKNQKKKGQTMSLAEFASDAVASDPMALPTAPRDAVPYAMKNLPQNFAAMCCHASSLFSLHGAIHGAFICVCPPDAPLQLTWMHPCAQWRG